MAKLPILMYHDISTHKSGDLVISLEKLEAQFAYLEAQDYQSYHFSELEGLETLKSVKNIVITFDDAYVSQVELAYPLLKKYKLKATIFVPFNFVGKKDAWNTNSVPIMTVEQLKKIDTSVFELGFHSFDHKKYDELSLVHMEQDITKSIQFVADHHLNFAPALAYPYGKYPKRNPVKREFFEMLKDYDLKYGLRIGNRINNFPFKTPYEIQRIDVRGDFSMTTFRRKLLFSRWF